MNESPQDFRARLLAAETGTPSEKYRAGLANLREQRIPRAQRLTMLLLVVFCAGAAMRMGKLALHPSPDFALPVVIALGIGSAGLLAGAVALGLTAWRGIIRRAADPSALQRIFIIATVIALGVGSSMALGMPDRAKGTQVLIVELIFLLIGCIFLIQSWMEQAELRMREKLLEIEMRIEQANLRS